MGYSAHKKRKLPQPCTALKTFFKHVIDKAYHLSTTGTSIGLCRFGSLSPPTNYGHPSDSKTECHPPSFYLLRQTNHSSSSSSHGQDNHPAITNAQNTKTQHRCDPPLTAATPTSTQHNPLPRDSSSQQVAAVMGIETRTTAMHLS
jgi:hypothetical protein